jgi:hypothetical protein
LFEAQFLVAGLAALQMKRILEKMFPSEMVLAKMILEKMVPEKMVLAQPD